MKEIPTKDMFVVNGSNKAAKSLMVKLCERSARPGAVVFVTDEEFDILCNGVIRIGLPEDPKFDHAWDGKYEANTEDLTGLVHGVTRIKG